MPSPSIYLSVVMPAYNERESLLDAVAEIERVILSRIPHSELIVVNDGSTDQTGAILDRLARDHSNIRAIHQANAGHGPALIRGISEARGTFIFVLDSDRQIPVEEFQKLWGQIEHHDAVFGVRTRRDDPLVRLVLTRLVRLAIFVLFQVYIRDSNSPFKLFRQSLWLQFRPLITERTRIPSLLFAIYSRRHRFRVCEIEVAHRRRTTGIPSLRLFKLLRFSGYALFELGAFWSKNRSRTLPQ